LNDTRWYAWGTLMPPKRGPMMSTRLVLTPDPLACAVPATPSRVIEPSIDPTWLDVDTRMPCRR
jgi:hypothetical protein